MPFANPYLVPEDWDTLLLGGKETPGVAEVSGADRPYKIDEKDGPGTEGAILTYRGKRLAKFTVKLKFWLVTGGDDDQLDEWDRFRPTLEQAANKKGVTALDVVHPALNDLGIKSVICDKIGQLVNEGKGLWSVTLSFIEYAPPKKGNATKTPSSSKTGTNGFPTLADPRELIIGQLLQQASKP